MTSIATPTLPAAPAKAPLRLGTEILQRYPVSALMIAPYVALILPQAIWYENPKIGFIGYLLALGFGAAVLIETAMLTIRAPYRNDADRVAANSRYPRIARVAVAVAAIGTGADVIKVIAGGGTIETQLTGRVAASPVVALMSPLGSWKYLGLALITSACLGGLMARKRYYRWLAIMAGAQVLVASYTAITAPLAAFVSAAALSGLMFGLIRARVVLAIGIALIAAWPTIYEVRNDLRREQGILVAEDLSAAERLRFDEQIVAADGYEVPARVPGVIGPVEVLRYGLLPRALDSDRPILATGSLLSDYVGGSGTNAVSFLPLGTVYFLEGPAGPVVLYGAAALVFMLLLRTGGGPGPVRLMMLYLAIAGPLSWTSSYPESLVGYVQSLVGMVPVIVTLRVFGKPEKLAS